jgi:hypothetical protein
MMSIRATSAAALACVAMLVQAPGVGAGGPQEPQHQHPQETAKPTADMSATCKAMMADHEKMMAGMKAADQRLDGLVATMNAAAGQAKVDATSAVVAEMVAQRKTMRDEMMAMHHRMMSHMMEHMQAGPQSMAMCPMMKMGGQNH